MEPQKNINTYSVQGKLYAIPNEKNDEFLQSMPKAQSVYAYEVNGKKLGIPKDKYSISFQSRLGKGWLTPFTDFRLAEMPKEGIKNLLILCPAFVSDCLETLEEIAMRGKEIFMLAGGESFTMIPCLNTHPLWVDTVEGYMRERIGNNAK